MRISLGYTRLPWVLAETEFIA